MILFSVFAPSISNWRTNLLLINKFDSCSAILSLMLECELNRWGFLVCKNPWTFIVSCCLITATCAIGMLNFTAENRPTKLWIPQDSGFVEHTDWLQDNFPNDMRFNSYIFLAENVLNTKHLLTVRFFDVPFPFRSNSFFFDFCQSHRFSGLKIGGLQGTCSST